MKIEVRSGVIYYLEGKKKGLVYVKEADKIAQANGHKVAEEFVKQFEGKALSLDKDLKIKGEVTGKGKKLNIAGKVRLAGTTRANGKYSFSDEEKKNIAMNLANRQVDKSMVEDEKRSAMSGYKDRLDRIAADINKLSRNIIDGYEFRDFECHVEIDWASNIKSYIAVDGGMVISVRALDPSDYQLKLDMEVAEDEKPSKRTK